MLTCILAIWDFADHDVFWRMISTFIVLAFGSLLFSLVNSFFGEEPANQSHH